MEVIKYAFVATNLLSQKILNILSSGNPNMRILYLKACNISIVIFKAKNISEAKSFNYILFRSEPQNWSVLGIYYDTCVWAANQ